MLGLAALLVLVVSSCLLRIIGNVHPRTPSPLAPRMPHVKATNKEDSETLAKSNWVQQYKRCNFNNSNTIVGELYTDPLIMEYLRKYNLFYIHIYKAGGTTIRNGLNKLISCNKLQIKKDKTTINNSKLTFTFVRDPISKFLSAFFEINKRILTFETHNIGFSDVIRFNSNANEPEVNIFDYNVIKNYGLTQLNLNIILIYYIKEQQ